MTFRSAMPMWFMGVPWSALMLTLFGVLCAAIFWAKPPTREIHQFEYFAMGAAFLFTGAFTLLGLGMLGYPFWAAGKARRTVHVITDKRLITLTAGRHTEIRSVEPHQIVSYQRSERADGSGSLRLVTGYEKDSDGDRVEMTEHLIGIPEVAKVERLLRELGNAGH